MTTQAIELAMKLKHQTVLPIILITAVTELATPQQKGKSCLLEQFL